MAKAKKETKVRLFENDLTITGKHATYIKFLINDAKLYDDYIDVYIIGDVYDSSFNKDEA